MKTIKTTYGVVLALIVCIVSVAMVVIALTAFVVGSMFYMGRL